LFREAGNCEFHIIDALLAVRNKLQSQVKESTNNILCIGNLQLRIFVEAVWFHSRCRLSDRFLIFTIIVDLS
jgi:hypothetical protein